MFRFLFTVSRETCRYLFAVLCLRRSVASRAVCVGGIERGTYTQHFSARERRAGGNA